MNMNIPAHSAGRLTVDDLDTRQRERAAVLEIAERIDAERRFGVWPVRRVMPLTQCGGPCSQGRRVCPCPDACEHADDPDNLNPGRALVLLFSAAALVAACFAVAFGLDALFRALS
jgi:hypothetical protein